MYGGTGADTFRFLAIGDAPLLGYDTIRDYSIAEGDRIDLSALDANLSVAGDQAFVYYGSGGMNGIAGALRFNNGFLEGDINGDAVADFPHSNECGTADRSRFHSVGRETVAVKHRWPKAPTPRSRGPLGIQRCPG